MKSIFKFLLFVFMYFATLSWGFVALANEANVTFFWLFAFFCLLNLYLVYRFVRWVVLLIKE